MRRYQIVTLAFALFAMTAFALLASTAFANDGSAAPAATDSYWFDVAMRYSDRSPAIDLDSRDSRWEAIVARYNGSARPAPAVSQSSWYDLAVRYAVASGARIEQAATPATQTSIVANTDRYWYEVAIRYSGGNDPFQPLLEADR
jgi:hypothetical protein